ncbi:MAG: UDP-3-O-(3-hydroxymyristoyl)glucosamine N-acyltransferase, partial [Bacteroidota bacterium]
ATQPINRPSKIEEGGTGSITFLANAKYESYVYSTTASAILVSHDFQPKQVIMPTLIFVENVYASIAILLKHFEQIPSVKKGISSLAQVDAAAIVSEDSAIDAFAVVKAGATIGANTVLHAHTYIGEDVQVGAHCVIHPGVKIYRHCILGDYCVIHANAVIGADGFGFAPQADGSYQKVAQIGCVEIEDHVEIGANTTIDRATMGATRIGCGVKLDNLVQIGHNVEIGEHTVIAAQTGVAGSTKIGKNCQIGGQVGFVGHLKIADGTKIQAQSGIASPVKQPNTALFGSPAIGYRDYIKSYAVFKQLPDLYKRLSALEKQLSDQ